ncbi:MAG: hypothetical protein FJ291_31120 [Planctomycetes bacterium]|nr:hypothetical protein [Planctomycetota bacterium]
MIEGACPVCRRVFKVDDRYAGMAGRCKACGAAIRVPGQPDEGLDGLPAAPSAQVAAPQPPAPTPPATPVPAEPQAAGAQQPHPADTFTRPHDARARYEPVEGPTPHRGSWVKEPEPAGERRAPEPEAPPRPQPVRAALSDRFITAPEPEPAPAGHRPALVVVACTVLGLLGVGFAAHMASAGAWGQGAAGLGLALAALAVVRLWTAHGDGLLAGLLLCLCVAGAALIPSQAPQANRVLLAAAGLALLLLILSLARRSGRDFFTH